MAHGFRHGGPWRERRSNTWDLDNQEPEGPWHGVQLLLVLQEWQCIGTKEGSQWITGGVPRWGQRIENRWRLSKSI